MVLNRGVGERGRVLDGSLEVGVCGGNCGWVVNKGSTLGWVTPRVPGSLGLRKGGPKRGGRNFPFGEKGGITLFNFPQFFGWTNSGFPQGGNHSRNFGVGGWLPGKTRDRGVRGPFKTGKGQRAKNGPGKGLYTGV